MKNSLGMLVRAITDAVNTAASQVSQQSIKDIYQYFDEINGKYTPKSLVVKRKSDKLEKCFALIGLAHQNPIVIDEMEVNIDVEINKIKNDDINEYPLTITDKNISTTEISLTRSGLLKKRKHANVKIKFKRDSNREYIQRMLDFVNN